MTDAADIEQELRRWCISNGHRIDPLGTIGEPLAALLLGLTPSGLRMRVYEGRARLSPHAVTASGRRRYLLRDVAALIEQNRQDALDW